MSVAGSFGDYLTDGEVGGHRQVLNFSDDALWNGRTPQMFSPQLRGSHTSGHAFTDERRLQFCHGANDGEHRPPHRAVRVNLILDADEADAKMVEFFQGHQQMPGAAGE